MVSVIIPIFNSLEFLGPCVKSVLAQTYEFVEVILVDDGSTDGSASLAEQFADKDSRVAVLHQVNGGAGAARNAAIDIAKGQYMVFVDSDDLLLSRHIEEMVAAAKRYDADLVVTQFQMVPPLKFPLKLDEPKREPQVELLTRAEALELLFYQKKITTSPWAKLYKGALFNEMRYPQGVTQEDLGLTYRLMLKANRVALLDSYSYLYVQREESVTARPSIESRDAILEFASEAVSIIEEEVPHLTRAARTRLFMESVYIIGQTARVARVAEASKRAVGAMHANRITVLMNKSAPWRARLYSLAALFGSMGVVALYRINHFLMRWRSCATRPGRGTRRRTWS